MRMRGLSSFQIVDISLQCRILTGSYSPRTSLQFCPLKRELRKDENIILLTEVINANFTSLLILQVHSPDEEGKVQNSI